MYGILSVLWTFTLMMVFPDRGKAQSLQMEIDIPAVFAIRWLPATPGELRENPLSDKTKEPLHWLEISGDESTEIIVKVGRSADSVQAYYIHTGLFDPGHAIPFKDHRTSFVLHRSGSQREYPELFYAWVGLRTDRKTQLTIVYL